MPLQSIGGTAKSLTERDVIQIIADALDVPKSDLNSATKSVDISEWDSMGILSILAALDREGIKCDIDRAESLASVSGVFEVCRSAGRLV